MHGCARDAKARGERVMTQNIKDNIGDNTGPLRMLVIDTATRRAVVAAALAGKVVAARSNEEQTLHAERLLPMVTEVLQQAGWELEQVQLLAIGKGPGSFTGVRVGMACGKGLGFSLSIPVVGIGSLDAMAEAVRSNYPERTGGETVVVALIDAKKCEVFAAAYDAKGAIVAGPDHVATRDIAKWIEKLGKNVLVAGEVAAQLDLGANSVILDEACDLPHPRAIAKLAEAKWNASKQDEIDSLDPLYVRGADITLPSRAIRTNRAIAQITALLVDERSRD